MPEAQSPSLTVRIHVDDPGLIPAYGTPGAAGADLRSADDCIWLEPGQRALVRTGVRAEIPEGYALFVHPRSGLALRHGVTVLNPPGLIDSDYRGEIGVILINTSDECYAVNKGERIAQAVVQRVETVNWQTVGSANDLRATDRGAGGFGSTGKG